MGVEKFFEILKEFFLPERAEQERINKEYKGKLFRPTKSNYGTSLISELGAIALNAKYGNSLEYKCNIQAHQ